MTSEAVRRTEWAKLVKRDVEIHGMSEGPAFKLFHLKRRIGMDALNAGAKSGRALLDCGKAAFNKFVAAIFPATMYV